MKLRLLLISLFLIPCVARAQTLGTCHIFPSNNPWNQRVDSLPVHWNSAKYIANVGGTIHLHPDFGSDPSYGIPWVAVNGAQPLVPIDITGYASESDPGPMPIPPNAPVEGGGVGDAHVLVVDTSNHHLYELYQGVKDQNDNGWAAASAAVFGLDSNNYRPDGWTSCDAAGLPIFPGLARLDECKAGVINHALRFTVPHTQKGWIFPARHEAGSTSDTTVMPMGLRLRLKASFDDSKDTGYAKVIITALKKYGMIRADNGSSWFISGETNTNWPDNDLNQLKAITGNDFEAVYTGPVRTQPNQYPDPVLPLPTSGGIQVPSTVRDTELTGNSNSFTITIQNNNSTPLTITRYALIVDTEFSFQDSSAHSIASGVSAQVTMNFNPTVAGMAVDTLVIYSNDGVTPRATVALVGLGTAGYFHLSVNPLNFGSVTIGDADTMSVNLKNIGNGELSVNVRGQTANPDFQLFTVGPQPTPPFVLEPGDTETATLIFSPSIEGPDTSLYALTVNPDAIDQFDTTLLLVGVGLPPSAVANNSASTFSLSVFPNPVAGIATIRLTGAAGADLIEITDALGRTVLRKTLPSAGGTLDLSTLSDGTYFVRATNAHGSAAERIVVAR